MTQPRRTLQQLTETAEPAWPAVKEWIAASSVPVEILPPDVSHRDEVLLEAQVTTRSPLGAILYESGGLILDHGWLRILGSGHKKLPRSFTEWNRSRAFSATGDHPGYIFFADDVVGGFFALDGGALGAGAGQVCYYAPDSLRWEPMNGMGFSQFLVWAMGPKFADFYSNLRWPGWQDEVSKVAGNQSLSLYPPLWTREGKEIANSSRRPCNIEEVWSLNFVHLPQQLQLPSENS